MGGRKSADIGKDVVIIIWSKWEERGWREGVNGQREDGRVWMGRVRAGKN